MFNYFDLTSSKDFGYLLSAMGTDVVINSSDIIKVLVTNTNLEQNYDDRRISSLSPIKRGDLIEYDNKQWMVISEQASKRYNKWKGIMRLLPYTITINSNCAFYTVPVYIDKQSFGVDDGKIISISEGQIYVYAPENEETRKIKNNNRFIKFGQAFKVVGIDRFSKPGIIIFTCEKDEINPTTDDVANDLAGGLACTLAITNADPIEINVDNTVKLSWTATGNPPVVFSSSDESVATIDHNGVITGVSDGQAIVTVANATHPLIKDNITVNVLEEAEHSIVINGFNEIITGESWNYTAQVFDGSTQVAEPVTWSLWDDTKTTTTTYATITSQDGTSCTVKAGTTINKYVQLKAELQSDDTVVEWLRIRIKPLF